MAVIYIPASTRQRKRAFERLSITPEALRDLLVATDHDVLVLDVRQPLDLLVDSEIIEGRFAENIPGTDVEKDKSDC